MNNLVLIAEQRAFDIQQIDYKDRFTVFSTIDEVFGGKESKTALDVKVALLSIEHQTTLVDKLRWLCESNMTPEVRDIVENQMDSKIRGYLSLGRDVIMANGYHITRLNQMLEPEEVIDEEGLKEKVYSEFSVGERLTNAEAKTRLAKVYQDFGLVIKAKASDLKKWFEVARAKVNGDNGLTFTKKK
jgi:hypothetical protein